MNSRSTLLRTVVFTTIATLAYLGSSAIPNVHAQDPASDASGVPTSSVQDKIELAQIRFAIRLQEVQVAKVERRLLGRGTEDADEMLRAKEKELLALENALSRVKALYEQGDVALERVQQAEVMRNAKVAELTACRSSNAAFADKIAVHDEKIKLLELRAELAKARLNQLKRQLKQ